MDLPKPPKLLGVKGLRDLLDLAERVYAWVSPVQDLLAALRAKVIALEAEIDTAAGAALDFGSPVALVPGNASSDGSSGEVADAEHVHALPAFGTTAGTFMEGNATPGGPPTGAAGGDLSGTYPNPTVDISVTAGFPRTLSTSGSIAASRGVEVPRAFEIAAGKRLTLGDYSALEVQGAAAPGGIWMPDAPPAFPSQWDSEFNGSSVSPYVIYDHGGLLTQSPKLTNDGMGNFQMLAPTQGSAIWAGAYRTLPTSGSPGLSEFTVYAKFSVAGAANGGARGAVAIMEDATNPNGDLVLMEGVPNSAIVAQVWSAYNTFSSTIGQILWLGTTFYVRHRVKGLVIQSDWSADGIGWIGLGSFTVAWTPKHYGILIFSQNTAADTIVKFDFVRMFEGLGKSLVNTTSIGRRI